MLFLVATVANVEVEISDVSAAFRVHFPQTLLELLVARAVKSREEIVVLESVLLLARRDVVAVIVISAALVGLFIAAQIFVAIRSVSRPAPEGSPSVSSRESPKAILTISCPESSN